MSKPAVEPDRDPDSGYDQDPLDEDYFMDDDYGDDNDQSGGESGDGDGDGEDVEDTPEVDNLTPTSLPSDPASS